MIRHTCNVCGKDFDEWDEQEAFSIVKRSIGYGSKYDGLALRLDICCDCMDKLIDSCAIDPVVDLSKGAID